MHASLHQRSNGLEHRRPILPTINWILIRHLNRVLRVERGQVIFVMRVERFRAAAKRADHRGRGEMLLETPFAQIRSSTDALRKEATKRGLEKRIQPTRQLT